MPVLPLSFFKMKSPVFLGILAFASIAHGGVILSIQRFHDPADLESSLPTHRSPPPHAQCLLQPGKSYVRMEHGQDAPMLQHWKEGDEHPSLVDFLENSFQPTQSPLTASTHDSAFSPRSISAQWQPLATGKSFVVPPTLRQHDTMDVWVVRAEKPWRWYHRWIGADHQFSFDLRLRSDHKLYFHRMMSSRVAKVDLKELSSMEPVTPLRPLTQVFVEQHGLSPSSSSSPLDSTSSTSASSESFICPDTTVYLFRYRFLLPSRLPADATDQEMTFELSLNHRKRFRAQRKTLYRSEDFILLGKSQGTWFTIR